MRFPTPDDMALAPAWENYLIAQFVQASIGQLSPRFVLCGLEVDGVVVTLHFRTDSETVGMPSEVQEIADEFLDLTGGVVQVQTKVRPWQAHDAGTDRHILWTYQRWLGDDDAPPTESAEA